MSSDPGALVDALLGRNSGVLRTFSRTTYKKDVTETFQRSVFDLARQVFVTVGVAPDAPQDVHASFVIGARGFMSTPEPIGASRDWFEFREDDVSLDKAGLVVLSWLRGAQAGSEGPYDHEAVVRLRLAEAVRLAPEDHRATLHTSVEPYSDELGAALTVDGDGVLSRMEVTLPTPDKYRRKGVPDGLMDVEVIELGGDYFAGLPPEPSVDDIS